MLSPRAVSYLVNTINDPPVSTTPIHLHVPEILNCDDANFAYCPFHPLRETAFSSISLVKFAEKLEITLNDTTDREH